MFNKKSTFLLIGIISAYSLLAQNKTGYSGMINAGVMLGSNDTKLHAQTIHGLKLGTWFAGAGAAIDDYFMQSFPVFLDIRKDLLDKANTVFVYAEGGANLLRKKEQFDNNRRAEFKPRLFYEGGVGYKVSLNSRLALNFSAGYSFKGFREDIYIKTTIPVGTQFVEEWVNNKTDIYKLHRLGLKAGLQF